MTLYGGGQISPRQAKLSWEPTVSLEDGLQRTIEWFRSINLDEFRAPANYG